MVAEGFNGSNGIFHLNKKFEVNAHCGKLYRILHERMSPVIEMRLLTGSWHKSGRAGNLSRLLHCC